MSEDLKKDLHMLINAKKFGAMALRRHEDVMGGVRGSYSNWQIRLYRKGKVTFKGLIHEEPMVDGAVGKIDDAKYFIDHVGEIKGGAHLEYFRMEKYLRMSYAIFNATMLDYLYKFTMPETKTPHSTMLGGMSKGLLETYEKVKGRKPGDELSRIDYFGYYALRTAFTALSTRSISVFFDIVPDALKWSNYMEKLKREKDGKEIFEISKILNDQGLIKFLELDKKKVVDNLNRRYKSKRQGIELLMELLKEKYREKVR